MSKKNWSRLKGDTRHHQQRIQVAQTAARLMHEHGMIDYLAAKHKACAQLGLCREGAHMPSNVEINLALESHMRLFAPEERMLCAEQLLEIAAGLMQQCREFNPRLTGAILTAHVHKHSSIEIHVFSDTPEHVMIFLMEQHIPFASGEKRLRTRRDHYESRPCLCFFVNKNPVELTVFSKQDIKHAPLSPIDGKPVRRVNLATIHQLLNNPERAS